MIDRKPTSRKQTISSVSHSPLLEPAWDHNQPGRRAMSTTVTTANTNEASAMTRKAGETTMVADTGITSPYPGD
jgi:hypothetical protein